MVQLTSVLNIIKFNRKLPRGNIFRGKYRLVRPVNDLAKANLVAKYKIEERNMFLLRHPYLSVEEEKGHVADQDKRRKWLDNKKKEKISKFSRHQTLTSHLCDLRTIEDWDK